MICCDQEIYLVIKTLEVIQDAADRPALHEGQEVPGARRRDSVPGILFTSASESESWR